MGGRCQRCGSPGSPSGHAAGCAACQLTAPLLAHVALVQFAIAAGTISRIGPIAAQAASGV